MCRMVGFISTKAVKVSKYFEAVKFQAEHGKHAPHKDGWGFATYNEDGFDFKKNLKPIWESTYSGPLKAQVAVIHARQASPSTKLIYQNDHPFVFQRDGEIWSFVHNGGITTHPAAWGNELDSKIFANLLEERIKFSDPLKAVMNSVDLIIKNCNFISLNSFLASSNIFISLRFSDDSHKLFYNRYDDLFEISTEPLEDIWNEMENNTIFYGQKTEKGIDIRKIKI